VWQLLVRRRPGFAPAQVGAEIQIVARSWRQPDGQSLRTGVQAATFFQLGGPGVNAACVTLLLAVGLILLVGGINVVNLLFARNAVREHELAIRLPLGRSLRSPQRGPNGTPGPSFTIIGMVQDARLTLLSRIDAVDLFFPRAATAAWLVRTSGVPQALIPSIYTALREIDPLLGSQSAIWTMEAGPMRVQQLTAQVPATIASLLGGIALALAAVGIFGVVSYGVARRTREFGIHLALGAQKRDVTAMVLRQTLRPVAWGVGFGLAGAVAISVLLTRLVLNAEMPDLTYGAGAFPVAPVASALGILLGVIALAAWLPARKAATVDPVVALRAE
jgi:hypothetical protein